LFRAGSPHIPPLCSLTPVGRGVSWAQPTRAAAPRRIGSFLICECRALLLVQCGRSAADFPEMMFASLQWGTALHFFLGGDGLNIKSPNPSSSSRFTAFFLVCGFAVGREAVGGGRFARACSRTVRACRPASSTARSLGATLEAAY